MVQEEQIQNVFHLSQSAMDALHSGTHSAPFDVLGPHVIDGEVWLTTFQPAAVSVASFAMEYVPN